MSDQTFAYRMGQVALIACVPVLDDNYVWLLHDEASGETVVIDPAVSDPVLAAAEARGWRITQIWNTHWHGDHVGGNAAIRDATGCALTGPAAEAAKIDAFERGVAEGDSVRVGELTGRVLDVPAHTAGHIAYFLPEIGVAFVGDTLFAMGCGRLFEGTAEQMFANMRKLESLPHGTRFYCAHEYTMSNGAFALHIEPDNAAIVERMRDVIALRDQGLPTVPTSLCLELATNPFMRARDVAELAERRKAKDNFTG